MRFHVSVVPIAALALALGSFSAEAAQRSDRRNRGDQTQGRPTGDDSARPRGKQDRGNRGRNENPSQSAGASSDQSNPRADAPSPRSDRQVDRGYDGVGRSSSRGSADRGGNQRYDQGVSQNRGNYQRYDQRNSRGQGRNDRGVQTQGRSTGDDSARPRGRQDRGSRGLSENPSQGSGASSGRANPRADAPSLGSDRQIDRGYNGVGRSSSRGSADRGRNQRYDQGVSQNRGNYQRYDQRNSRGQGRNDRFDRRSSRNSAWNRGNNSRYYAPRRLSRWSAPRRYYGPGGHLSLYFGLGSGYRYGSIYRGRVYGYRGPIVSRYDNRSYYGDLRLHVSPRDAAVYVDGYYAGVVDDFDGFFQRLTVEVGAHVIEIEAPGLESQVFDVYVDGSRTIDLHADLLR